MNEQTNKWTFERDSLKHNASIDSVGCRKYKTTVNVTAAYHCFRFLFKFNRQEFSKATPDYTRTLQTRQT